MPGKNKILVEWLISEDKGKRNTVNDTHIIKAKEGLQIAVS
jgi:hypothetical protein